MRKESVGFAWWSHICTFKELDSDPSPSLQNRCHRTIVKGFYYHIKVAVHQRVHWSALGLFPHHLNMSISITLVSPKLVILCPVEVLTSGYSTLRYSYKQALNIPLRANQLTSKESRKLQGYRSCTHGLRSNAAKNILTCASLILCPSLLSKQNVERTKVYYIEENVKGDLSD